MELHFEAPSSSDKTQKQSSAQQQWISYLKYTHYYHATPFESNFNSVYFVQIVTSKDPCSSSQWNCLLEETSPSRSLDFIFKLP